MPSTAPPLDSDKDQSKDKVGAEVAGVCPSWHILHTVSRPW